LTIIPAAIARNLTTRMKCYLVLASTLGGMIAFVGVLVSAYGTMRPGPTIILLGIGLFVVSLLRVKQ
jgi:ABC-type Mn2+/Zn2+ transport system permease subunit